MFEGTSPTTTAMGVKEALRRRWRPGEKFIEGWIFLAGITVIVVLLGIIVLLMREGLPIFLDTPPWEFFFGTKWYPVSEPPTFGIMPFFVATIWVTLVATAISVPVGIAARRNRIALYLHEQNAHAGLANRMMGRLAITTFTSFEQTEGAIRPEHVGNPIRADLADFSRADLRHAAFDRYGLEPGRVTVGVVGGSLGNCGSGCTGSAAKGNISRSEVCNQLAEDGGEVYW